MLAAIVAVALVGSLGGVWLLGAHELAGAGDRLTAPGAVGQTFYTGIPLFPARGGPGSTTRIDLKSVTPKIAENSADATVEIMACSGPKSFDITGGGDATDLSSYCPGLTPFRSGSFIVGARSTTGVVMAITPRRAGTTHIEGSYVSYWHRLRHGRQHVGYDVVINTK
ncbi:MAG: hypothetical protein ABI775_03290 [Pseudonocardiales bacterium]|nr:hypothetical protein [Actinomycetota bacterium]